MLKNKLLLLVSLFVLFSCQKIEVLDEVVFTYELMPKIILNAEAKKIFDLYEPKYSSLYIDHSLIKPPVFYLNELLDKNVNILGSENSLIINIFDASFKKSEIKNTDEKSYLEKKILLFEVSFLVEFLIYDNSNFLLASSIVEAKRTTTSGKNISIYETERIIDMLIFDCLIDFSYKSNELIKKNMNNFII